MSDLHTTVGSPTISACLIVNNEEVLLPDCLRSLLHAVDDIVVVDTGSTDTTIAVARSFGCTVIETPWENDFSRARNSALSHATGDWILVIDADERLHNAEALRRTVAESPATTGGFLVEVESSILRTDGSVDTYSSGLLRLFRNDERIRFYGAIHEQVIDTVIGAGYGIERSAARLLHLGYNLSAEDMQSKHQRNLSLLDSALQHTPEDGYLLLQRGKTLLALGRTEAALADFQRIARHETMATDIIRAQAWNYTGLLHYQAGHKDDALQCGYASLRLLPHQSFAHFLIGETWTDLGKHGFALESYLQMRMEPADDLRTAVAGEYRLPPAQLAFRIGRAYAGLRQWDRACEEFRRGLDADPRDLGCLVGCAELALRRNEAHEAVRLLRTAVDIAPDRDDLRRYLSIAETHAAAPATHTGSETATVTISGAMIADDDTDGLERALDSLARLCNDIVVVHTGTSDSVRTLLRSRNVRLVLHPPDDDCSAACNAALEHCTGQWVVVLHTDECISDTAAERLRAAATSADETTGGFVVSINSIPGSPHSGDTALRLFRNLPGVRYEGYVHEQIAPAFARAGMVVRERPDIVLDHYPRPMTPARRDRYRRLLEQEIDRLGNEAEWPLFRYALLLLDGGNEEEVVDSLQALDRYLQHPLMRREHAAVLLNSYARRLLVLQQWEQLAGIAGDSIAYVPDQREAWWYSALASSHLGEYTQTLHALRLLCTSYEADYHSALVPEQAPSVEEVIHEGRKAAARAGSTELHELVEQFARRHGYGLRDTDVPRETPQTTADTTARPLLSVSMIVKNEEKFLPGCLESIRDIADEIVIADTGSTDATLSIARSFGAVLVETTWEGDFALARNYSLRHCTGRWVLYLDADERIEPAQKEYIRSMLAQAPEDIGAFLCTIISPHRQRNNSTEQHTGAYPRLFRNLGYPAVRFQGRVHEQISPSILAAGKTIAASDVLIHHLGYEQSLEVMQKKVQRNFELLMRHIREEPTNGQAWLHLGFTLAFMGKTTEAEEALKFALKLGSLNPHLEASAASTLAQIAGSSRKFVDALHWAEYSIARAPQQIYGLHLKAYALLYLGRYDEAERAFLEVLHRIDHPQHSQAGFDVAVQRDTVVDGLNRARRKTGSPISKPAPGDTQ